MKKKIFILIGIVAIIGASVAYYMFNMPHRNVTNSKVDYKVEATVLVNEFIQNNNQANDKYLAEDGDSKILQVTGRVDKITKDQNGQTVVLIKETTAKMGVSATFTSETNNQTTNIKIGDNITIKGVIRSGAEYDEDLDLAEDVIIEKSSLMK